MGRSNSADAYIEIPRLNIELPLAMVAQHALLLMSFIKKSRRCLLTAQLLAYPSTNMSIKLHVEPPLHTVSVPWSSSFSVAPHYSLRVEGQCW